MTAIHASPLAVCTAPPPAENAPRTCEYPGYVHEILAHAGLCYRTIDHRSLAESLDGVRVLVTVGEIPFDENDQGVLDEWIEQGNAWIAVAGASGLAETLGVDIEQPYLPTWGGGAATLGEGYMDPHARSHPILAGFWAPLHYFGGIAVIPAGADVLAFALDAHQRTGSSPDAPLRAAITERPVGQGRTTLIAPDITGAVVRIQQGIAVTRDGVPAPDGTAPRTDGILKSDDGAVLDWHFDRSPVPGIPGYRAFLDPIADRWRTLLLRAIFHEARALGVSLPLLWLYPRNLPALAHLSHDTDLCEPGKAAALLDILREERIRSTWCVILPGYPPETIDAIRQDGHELAFHFDALSNAADWSEARFGEQLEQVAALIGERPTTNKNHYLRWQGDVELFEWCARAGISLDQSKGASKTGEAGFLFGTCHPYRPVDPDGRTIDVLELPTPTQDMIVFCPDELAEPLTQAVAGVHGILHLLFHPAHIESPGVANALRAAIAGARALGMEFWTARAIAEWETARRRIQWGSAEGPSGARLLTLTSTVDLPGATLLWLDAGSTPIVTIDGEDYPGVFVERWGFRFAAATFDMEAHRTHLLEGPR